MVSAAVMVITVRNPVYAVLFLILTFFSCAGLWVLLEAEFLAFTLVVVYVGAVAVLFLFVVMMLDINLSAIQEGFIRYLPVGILVGVIMLTELLMVIWMQGESALSAMTAPEPMAAGYSNTSALGELLYTQYLWPFEITGIVLLVAIIAAITLTLPGRAPKTRVQHANQQVQVRREDRIRLVKMKSESPEEN